jgi:hypothetical protein
MWHRNGQLAEEQTYRHGIVHGICRQWNEAGKLLGSYRMDNVTGLQRSWHCNGRLNQEFSTVEGQFCGRTRMWLQDGTLISDDVELFGRSVTPEQYRRAAAQDPRLPKLRGKPAKVPVRNRAMEKHMQRVFVMGLLPDIYRNKRGDQFADNMLVQLPKAAKQRKAIRAVCAQLRKDDLGAVLPDRDLGESHLYILMD